VICHSFSNLKENKLINVKNINASLYHISICSEIDIIVIKHIDEITKITAYSSGAPEVTPVLAQSA
jgi:hypothetical protein